MYAVVDENGDHRADRVYTLAKGLELPVGVAYRNGALYVSAVDRILRYDDIEKHLSDPPAPVVITDQLPKDSTTAGNIWRSAPMENCMSRWECLVIFVSLTSLATAILPG